jgi:hypothetical protein
MTKKKNELDVDFIGGSGPLTKEEEKLVSDFIKSRKRPLSKKRKTKSQSKKKVTA